MLHCQAWHGKYHLNFKFPTSAFFRPTLVSDFLADEQTFLIWEKEQLRGLGLFVGSDYLPKSSDDSAGLEQDKKLYKRITCIGENQIKNDVSTASPEARFTLIGLLVVADSLGLFPKLALGSKGLTADETRWGHPQANGSKKLLDLHSCRTWNSVRA